MRLALAALISLLPGIAPAAGHGRGILSPRPSSVPRIALPTLPSLPSFPDVPVSQISPLHSVSGPAHAPVHISTPRLERLAEKPVAVHSAARALPLQTLTAQVATLVDSAKPEAPVESGLAASAQFFSGTRVAGAEAVFVPGPSEPAPLPPSGGDDKQKARNVNLMRAGTASFKLGMEVVKLGVPLYALQELGGATWVAMLAVSYGVAQAVFSSWAGALIDRFPAKKVLAGAIRVQAGLVVALLALGWTGLLTPWLLLPIYGLFGRRPHDARSRAVQHRRPRRDSGPTLRG